MISGGEWTRWVLLNVTLSKARSYRWWRPVWLWSRAARRARFGDATAGQIGERELEQR